jgi:hypothetical protein
MPRAAIPCPLCGKKRHVSGKAPATRVCWACHIAGLGSPTNPKKPGRHQQLQMSHVSQRAALQPTRSWWAVPDSQFAANLAAEANRLRLIGPDLKQKAIGSDV